MDEDQIDGMIHELLIDVGFVRFAEQVDADEYEELRGEMSNTIKEHLAMAGVDYV